VATSNSLGCQTDYAYDALGRLKQAAAISAGGTSPCPVTGTWSYAYDAVGNRLSETNPTATPGTSTFTYDANDRLVSATGMKQASYTYDAAGNLLTETHPPAVTGNPDLVSQYRWDAEGRLVGFTPPGATTGITYRYDADGQLVRETHDAPSGQQPAATDITMYLADKNLAFSQIVEERDGAGSLKTAYQFADGQLVKQVRSGASSFYHADHLSVGELTDSTGAIVNRYLYSPYGELTLQTNGAGSGSPTVPNVQLFAGERLNSDMGLYYLRARYMDPKVGRFDGIDPRSGKPTRPISLHVYIYANADPIDQLDPSGMMGLGDIGAGLEGSINVAVANVRAGFAISRVAGGSALRALGQAVEIAGRQVLGKALRIDPVRIGPKVVNGPGGRRVIDFFLTVGQRVATIEAKYKIPPGGSQAFTRLVAQMQSAMATEEAGQVVLWTLKAPTDAELAALLATLPEQGASIQFVNGLVGLGNWARFFFVGF
jgi:RHS repeat-associated protein